MIKLSDVILESDIIDKMSILSKYTFNPDFYKDYYRRMVGESAWRLRDFLLNVYDANRYYLGIDKMHDLILSQDHSNHLMILEIIYNKYLQENNN